MLRAMIVTLAVTTPVLALDSEDSATTEVTAGQVFDYLESAAGRWAAQGAGFQSELRYRTVLPGVVVSAENTLTDKEGRVMARYFAVYFLNAAKGQVEFRTLKDDGELHEGTAYFADGALWHDAEVTGGGINRYRSAMKRSGEQMFYRAAFGELRDRARIEKLQPLAYRRVASPDEG